MTARPIAEVLAGQRILVTGSTGFVGEALLERLLHDLPDTPVTLLVRARGALSARDRVQHVLAGPAFARLRERRGDDLTPLLDRHITVLEGDLDAVPPLPDDLDIVIHCAGEVSFDPAIDDGFATNVHGTLNLLAAIEASGSRPHYVHVSTAYVAGRQQGHVREGRLDHDVDWRSEAAIAAQLRERAEIESRSATQLAIFTAEAEEDHGSSGALSVSSEAERRRKEWVTQTLVEAGRERGRSLGWTDCYTFTKAMAERAVEETAVNLPVSVLRPSIIESALRQPYAGWIEGFKMAEPIILAFGRGDLPDFPGIPDGVIDIIPVDLVVNATIAAAATRPEPGTPAYYTICSGARNPLSFRLLHDLVREYFVAHPMVQRDRGEVRVPRWQWQGSERVDQLIRLGDRAHRTADRVVTSLPRSARTRDWARSLDRQRGRLDFLRRYFDLYRPYADAELHFSDRSTLALHEALHPDDVEPFGFDATDDRLALLPGRRARAGGRRPAQRAERDARTPSRRRPAASPRAPNVVAVFDMDGTLLSSNVVESYLWLRLPELAVPAKAREVSEVARALPRWLATQKRDRASFLRMVYRRYDGASMAELERIVDEELTPTMLTRLSAGAVRAIREHRTRRPPPGAGDRRGHAADPADRRAVRRGRRGRAFGRRLRALHRPPRSTAAGRRGPCRLAAAPRARGRLGPRPRAMRTPTPPATCRCCARSVSRSSIDPDVVLSRVARKERWPVEIWHSGTEQGATAGAGPMISALEVYRSLPRYVAARAVGPRLPGLLAGPLAPLRLVHRDGPRLRGDGWVRVRPRLSGICGSDLATLSGHTSLYFTPLVSMPFVPGHEVVGETRDDAPGMPAGTRVVIDPILGCRARGLEPCVECAKGQHNRCDRITAGHLSPGLQTGYCADTGGGWSGELVAHVSQLHAVPDDLPDNRAVLIEPLACAVHIARRAALVDGGSALIVGAGAVGLFTALALRELTPAGHVTIVAKHRRQAELGPAVRRERRGLARRGRDRGTPVDPRAAARAGARPGIPARRRRRRDRRRRLPGLGRHRTAHGPGRRPGGPRRGARRRHRPDAGLVPRARRDRRVRQRG